MKKTATLRLYRTCNYNCSYCSISHEDRKSKFGLAITEEGMKKILKFFDQRGEWHIQITGGEPTIHPNFIEFCQKITYNHYLNMVTNNSISFRKLNEFVNVVNPKKIQYIQCSLQEVDEDDERLDVFLEKMKMYINNGFRAYVSYVGVPDRLEKVEKYFNLFMNNSIPFVVQVYHGEYKGKKYPEQYTKQEIAFLDKFMVSSMYRSLLDVGVRKPSGKTCGAGYRRILADAIDGKVYSCLNDTNPIGNIYDNKLILSDKPFICGAKNCSCIFEPHYEIEGILWNDLENIFNGAKNYDKNLYEQYTRSSIAGDLYNDYWNKVAEQKKDRKVKVLKKIFKNAQDKSIGIYGTGEHTDNMLESYTRFIGDISFKILFFDSDSSKWGRVYFNSKINAPDAINNIELDRIIISSYSFQDEIYESIKNNLNKNIDILKCYNENETILFINE